MVDTFEVGQTVRIRADLANGAPVKAGDTGTIVAIPEHLDHVVVKMDHEPKRAFTPARKLGGDYMITPDNLEPV